MYIQYPLSHTQSQYAPTYATHKPECAVTPATAHSGTHKPNCGAAPATAHSGTYIHTNPERGGLKQQLTQVHTNPSVEASSNSSLRYTQTQAWRPQATAHSGTHKPKRGGLKQQLTQVHTNPSVEDSSNSSLRYTQTHKQHITHIYIIIQTIHKQP